MSYRYTYASYAEIPSSVKNEFTLEEIKELRLCPANTCPGALLVKTIMEDDATCCVCGKPFRRSVACTETVYERRTCGRRKCRSSLLHWLQRYRRVFGQVDDPEQEILTFLSSTLYDLLRKRMNTRKRSRRRTIV